MNESEKDILYGIFEQLQKIANIMEAEYYIPKMR